jgi:hypothetical protein
MWSGAKTVGKETVRTGWQTLSDIANKPADVAAKAQNFVKKLRVEGSRKRKRNTGGHIRKRIKEPKGLPKKV